MVATVKSQIPNPKPQKPKELLETARDRDECASHSLEALGVVIHVVWQSIAVHQITAAQDGGDQEPGHFLTSKLTLIERFEYPPCERRPLDIGTDTPIARLGTWGLGF